MFPTCRKYNEAIKKHDNSTHPLIPEEKKSFVTNIATNLRKLMDIAHIGENELSRRTNVTQPVIHRLLSGENTNPKLLTLQPIANYFMVSISQLIGEDDITKAWVGYTSGDHTDWKRIPLTTWEDIIAKRPPGSSILTDYLVTDKTFALTVPQDDFRPIFPKNSIIILEPHLEAIHGDYIVVMEHNQNIDIQQLLFIEDNLYSISLGNRLDKQNITTLDKEKIIGTVIRTIYDHRSGISISNNAD